MDETNYRDSLIEINSSHITFFNFGLLGGSKTVRLWDIDKIDILKPDIWNGKYRFHGSGDFRTWFPADYARFKRNAIFIVHLKGKRLRIGFTVKNTKEVIKLLKNKKLVGKDLERTAFKKDLDTKTTEKYIKILYIGAILIFGVIIPVIILLIFL